MALDLEKAMEIFAKKHQEREKLGYLEEVAVKKKTENIDEKELLDFARIIESKLDEQIVKGNLGYYSNGDSTLSVYATVKDCYDCDCGSGELLAKKIEKILSSLYLPLDWTMVEVNWSHYSGQEGKVFTAVLW